MQIEIRNSKTGTHKVDVNLYNRGDCFGIDYNNSKSQVLLSGVTTSQSRQMIREIVAYEVKDANTPELRAAVDSLFEAIKKAKGQ